MDERRYYHRHYGLSNPRIDLNDSKERVSQFVRKLIYGINGLLGTENKKKMCLVRIRHRGGHPEHSREAFLDSFQNNLVDGVECDVQFTLDHHAVVFHDETLWRLFGVDRRVRDMTYGELRDYNLLLLTEVLELCPPGSSKKIILEIKGWATLGPGCSGLLKAILAPYLDTMDLVVASFDESFLTSWTWTPRMFLCSNRISPLFWNHSFEYIGLSSEIVSLAYIREIRRCYFQVGLYVFTVNDRSTLEALTELHIDGIITDCVDDHLGPFSEKGGRTIGKNPKG